MFILNQGSPDTRVRPKIIPVVPVSRPTLFFSADPIILSMRLNVRPYFLRVVVGCSHSTACKNGICCHNNY